MMAAKLRFWGIIIVWFHGAGYVVADAAVLLVLRQFVYECLKSAVLCGYPFTSYDKYMLDVMVLRIFYLIHNLHHLLVLS